MSLPLWRSAWVGKIVTCARLCSIGVVVLSYYFNPPAVEVPYAKDLVKYKWSVRAW